MARRLLRAGIILLSAVALLVAGVLAGFAIWRSSYVRELEAASRVAATPLGDVEYAVVGDGIPYLYVHGAPGGYDQGLADRRVRPDAFSGLQTITVSRPGYLRTPLSSGRTPAEQADLFAALLDYLHVERVAVMAVSAGAASAIQFAIRHSDRTAGLILLAPGIQRQPDLVYQNPTGAAGTTALDVVLWAAGRWLGPKMLPGLDAEDPEQVALARLWAKSVIPLGHRTEGSLNDFRMMRELDVEKWPLEDLRVPVLILHGDADRNAPYEGSVALAARVPNAELVTMKGVGHEFMLTRARQIDEQIRPFLARVFSSAD